MFSFLRRLNFKKQKNIFNAKHRRCIMYIFIASTIVFLFLATYLSYSFFLNQKDIQDRAYASAKKQAFLAANKIDQDFSKVMLIAQSIANDLDAETLKPGEIPDRLKKEVAKNSMIIGIGTAFHPYGYIADKLYSPYYSKDQHNIWQLTEVSKVYDYTKPKLLPKDPDTNWYLEPAKNNTSTWMPPFYGTVSKDLISVYSVPFYYPNKGRSLEAQRGVVMLSLSLSDIDLMMAQLNLGKTGYALVTSKENIVIAHPEKSEIGRKLNLQMPTTQQNLKLYSYQNPISGQNYWTFNFNLKSTGWKLVVMLNKDDFASSPADKMRNTTLIITFFLLGILSLLGILLRLDYCSPKRCWFFSIIFSMSFFIGMISIWYAFFKIIEPVSGTKIIEQSQLNRFLLTHDITTHKTNKILVPTGVIVNNINFATQETAAINGFIWQRLPIDTDSKYYGFFFPQSVGYTSINKISEKIYNNEKIILWSFFTTLKEEFNPVRYPLDKENFTIQLLPLDMMSDVFLIPDLQNHTYLKPDLLPGVKDNINLKIWKVDASFYSYENNKAQKNIYFLKDKNSNNLQFNISLHRALVNSLINNLIPLFLVAIMLYAVVTTNILTTIIPISGAMLFFIALGHFSMRNYIVIEGMSYLDYLYVFMYAFITIITVSTIIASKNIFAAMAYKNNLITKILYWPFLTIFFYLITVYIFG